jgi:phytoene dehydrogenase-like protein
MTRSVDAVVIGSGHNGLVAAVYLARAGWSVEVLERNDAPGGAVATEELTAPGYRHDTFSSWHPLFHASACWAELSDELRARGLEYVNADDVVTATVRRDGSAVVAHRDPARTAAGLTAADADAYAEDLGGLGRQMDVVGELLGAELHSAHALRLAARLGRRLGVRDGLAFGARVVSSARGWLESRFEGREVPDLLAPWVLHTGLTPEDAGGGFQLVALAGALHELGLPVVRGGSRGFVDAFVRMIEDHGGAVWCGVDVERIVTVGGRATGVVAGGEVTQASRAVIANTTPTQLYGRLLDGDAAVPARVAREAARFRFGDRAGTQIHLALSEPPRWRGDERLAAAPIVHLTDGLDAVSRACAEARAGLLPAEPTIVCGQPTALDPSRAPAGGAILWIQLQEVPYEPRGDAAGEIEVGGGWSEELEHAYADRIVARLARHIENVPDAIVGRAVLSPPTLERRNPNLARGDIYAGATTLEQSYLWRPLPSHGSHATPVPGLYQCGASTYPGPGLNAASGRIVARQLLEPSLPRRIRARIR